MASFLALEGVMQSGLESFGTGETAEDAALLLLLLGESCTALVLCLYRATRFCMARLETVALHFCMASVTGTL